MNLTHVEAMAEHDALLLSRACVDSARVRRKAGERELAGVLWRNAITLARRARRAAARHSTAYRYKVGVIGPGTIDPRMKDGEREMVVLNEMRDGEWQPVWVDATGIQTLTPEGDTRTRVRFREGREIVVNGTPAELAAGIEYANAAQELERVELQEKIAQVKQLEAQMQQRTDGKVIDFNAAKEGMNDKVDV